MPLESDAKFEEKHEKFVKFSQDHLKVSKLEL